MIDAAYVQTMARYNRWQNRSLYAAAEGIGDAERRRDRGAFFGSIHATFNHLLWADMIWMSRWSDVPAPSFGGKDSVRLCEDWADLVRERRALDRVILDWAANLAPDALTGDLAWFSGMLQRAFIKPRWLLVTHFFNHQTHHRGQVHAMLTAAGARPEATDLGFMEG